MKDPAEADFVAHIVELLDNWGEATPKRMFGGYGIFREGLMFALVAYSELYFKVDDESRPDFEEEELTPFVYESSKGKTVMSYYHAPESAFRNGPAMAKWAEKGWQAAVRADVAKPPSKQKRQK